MPTKRELHIVREGEEPEGYAKDRVVWLVGEMTDESAAEAIAKMVELHIEDRVKPMVLMVFSPGGDVTAGLALYDVIRQLGNVDTYALGRVQSAALLPFVAGETRYVYENVQFYVHRAIVGMNEVTVDASRSYIAETERYEQGHCRKLALHSRVSAGEWAKMRREERRFGAAEALEWGLADEVVGPGPAQGGT